MELKTIEIENTTIVTLAAEETKIETVQDATDLLGNAHYMGAGNVILEEKNLGPGFFDLKTGIAGDILQKYANYGIRLAIIGDFEKYESNALKAFITECNRGNSIFFVASMDEAVERLKR